MNVIPDFKASTIIPVLTRNVAPGSTIYSDKKNWQLIRLFKNDYSALIWVGISAQSPLGEGTSTVFEDISLTKQSISDFRLGI